jgi:hypothetical protein
MPKPAPTVADPGLPPEPVSPAPALAQQADTPPPPGPGSWRWDPVARLHVRLTKET